MNQLATTKPTPPTMCLYFGSPDECAECGGSATLGGKQKALVTEIGRFCSVDCATDAAERQARSDAAAANEWCPQCGYDNHEHARDCITEGS